MLFTVIMKRKYIYIYFGLAALMLVLWLLPKNNAHNNSSNNFSETVKIALRDVGNTLLLKNKDSISLVLPVLNVNPNTYKLAFNSNLSLEPNTLVKSIKQSLNKLNLPSDYRVEVLSCINEDVTYSYQMNAEIEKTIIPCSGRVLPYSCYQINLKFMTKESSFSTHKNLWLIIFVLIVAIGIVNYIKTKNIPKSIDEKTKDKSTYNLGYFKFYPEENKLVKEALEINLSKKECELLSIFVSQPNTVISREELTKRVWEDQGVFVGRSLDTYISKLRKILKEDSTLKLTNIHGVGYKLEIF